MAKPEWGTKRTCQSCGAKFYDLTRSPILCPGCGVTYEPEAALKVRRVRSEAKTMMPKPRNLVVEEPELVTADPDFALDDIEADAEAVEDEAEEEVADGVVLVDELAADQATATDPVLEVDAGEGEGEVIKEAIEEDLTEIDEGALDADLDAEKDEDDDGRR